MDSALDTPITPQTWIELAQMFDYASPGVLCALGTVLTQPRRLLNTARKMRSVLTVP